MKYFTIGMAGHIDHGKTSLTRALTNVDTDRLKEEKERNISIELGYAPFKLDDEFEVSIIDVPGHERFIRQMIAGVAGIDLVILVVAADEGVMPQTREHLDILSLLGIERGMIAVSKADRVDEEIQEIVELDIREAIEGTFLEEAPFFFVDSLSGNGIDGLKSGIRESLVNVTERNAHGAFRLPIDQVFTVHGQGTVVRGTVYEGVIEEGDMLAVLPQGYSVRARQIQVHHQQRSSGRAGQRVAVNIGGITKQSITRGNVLVAPGYYESTTTIDISLKMTKTLTYPLKQRGAIKLHIGTAEIYGKIVFFDRNELLENDGEIFCQLRLDQPIVTRRGDRFILRRPTPMETIGGGRVIDAHGERYRFGVETISMLAKKSEGTPEELITSVLIEKKLLPIQELAQQTGLQPETVQTIIEDMKGREELFQLPSGEVTVRTVVHSLRDAVVQQLQAYHEQHPLREGIIKAELIQGLAKTFPKRLSEWLIQLHDDVFRVNGPYVASKSHQAHPPQQWGKRIEQAEKALKEEGLTVTPLEQHLQAQKIPETLYSDLLHYFTRQAIVYQLDEKLYIHQEPFKNAVLRLFSKSNTQFSLQQAKEVTELSRKYLVPFLEKLDQLELTSRLENERKWRTTNVEQFLNQ
ncbi:selenocysteine-specific translation elongation factor [Halalkalibacter urbisdiaboli]|uniref:selenocysteine-specific translation elongation factor n=1 Tax=Halalkalibacter urbisdiaboli TaxID=1960589 RepID=UPI000B42EDE9|nr:selenocysteine-specific translation elongation factor [Halalkalibacter urbisdiaboli]